MRHRIDINVKEYKEKMNNQESKHVVFPTQLLWKI